MTSPRDVDQLWHRLADRLDAHPVDNWSPSMLVAMIGIMDAHALDCRCGQLPVVRPSLRLVKPVPRRRGNHSDVTDV